MTSEPCDYNFKKGWYCTAERNHDGPCPLWPTRWTRITHWLIYRVRYPR